jgi:hypothetical protein
MSDAEAFMIVGTCVALFGSIAWVLTQAIKAWPASIASRTAAKHGEAYEALADKAVYTQQKLLEQQERLFTEMTEVKSRVVSIERKLAEVD